MTTMLNLVQEIGLFMWPQGGQEGARANAARAIARDNEAARDRDEAIAAMLEAEIAHRADQQTYALAR